MNSWVTLDSWVKQYPIIYLQSNLINQMSLYCTVGSSKSFTTLYMLRSQAILQLAIL